MKTHSYPAWFYGPHGESKIFQHDGEVPSGWHDHPSKVVTPEKTGSKPMPAQTDKVPAAQRGAAPAPAKNDATSQATGGKATDNATGDQSNTLDAHGHAWNADIHAATQTKTKDGLWRLKVGASRPAPKEGFPKPAFNL